MSIPITAAIYPSLPLSTLATQAPCSSAIFRLQRKAHSHTPDTYVSGTPHTRRTRALAHRQTSHPPHRQTPRPQLARRSLHLLWPPAPPHPRAARRAFMHAARRTPSSVLAARHLCLYIPLALCNQRAAHRAFLHATRRLPSSWPCTPRDQHSIRGLPIHYPPNTSQATSFASAASTLLTHTSSPVDPERCSSPSRLQLGSPLPPPHAPSPPLRTPPPLRVYLPLSLPPNKPPPLSRPSTIDSLIVIVTAQHIASTLATLAPQPIAHSENIASALAMSAPQPAIHPGNAVQPPSAALEPSPSKHPRPPPSSSLLPPDGRRQRLVTPQNQTAPLAPLLYTPNLIYALRVDSIRRNPHQRSQRRRGTHNSSRRPQAAHIYQHCALRSATWPNALARARMQPNKHISGILYLCRPPPPFCPPVLPILAETKPMPLPHSFPPSPCHSQFPSPTHHPSPPHYSTPSTPSRPPLPRRPP